MNDQSMNESKHTINEWMIERKNEWINELTNIQRKIRKAKN